MRDRAPYLLISAIGLAAFAYPFWLPEGALGPDPHSAVAPVLSALLVGGVLVLALLEARRSLASGVTVALLGVLSASAALLRLLDLPGGGSGMFFLVILAGVAFGSRFGLLLGMLSMALSALLTGGIGPWLPFQMLGSGWMGASSGLLGPWTRRLPARIEVAAVTAFGWVWGFAYGAILNLWSWPFLVGEGSLSWQPGLPAGEALARYYDFYVATSLAWDAAGATANAVLIALTAGPLLASMRRFSRRLAPVVVLCSNSGRNEEHLAPARGKPVEVRR